MVSIPRGCDSYSPRLQAGSEPADCRGGERGAWVAGSANRGGRPGRPIGYGRQQGAGRVGTAVSGPFRAPARVRRALPRLVVGALCVYVAVYVVWTAVHWSTGDRTVVSDLAPIPVALAATCFAWHAGHDRRGAARRKVAWQWIAFGCASWTIAECLWFYFEAVRHRSPFPSPADWFYLAFYVFVFAGLVRLPVRQLGGKERLAFALDLATVMFVTLMVVWYLVVDPTVNRGDSAVALCRAVQ